MGTAWQGALQVAGGIGLATTIQGLVSAFRSFATESVSLAARMQDLHRSFVALEGSSQAANRTLGFLFETARRNGVSVTDLAEGFRRLEAGAKGTVLTNEDLRRSMEGLSAGARIMGLSGQQVTSAIVALEQMLTKGKLSSEELVRQLGNAVPGGLAIMAQGLKTTTADLRVLAEAGIVPVATAVVAFTEQMGQIGKNAGPLEGLSKTFADLKNETVAWMTAIGEGLGQTIKPFLDTVISLSAELRKLFQIRPPGSTEPQGAPTGLAALTTSIYQHLPLPFIHALPAPFPFGGAPAGQPMASSPYTGLIQGAAKEFGLDPGLLSQVIRQESSFKPGAVSAAGAVGLGGIMPKTAEYLQPGITEEQLRDPATNVRLAAKYLAEQLKLFKDSTDQVSLALAAYNAGPGKVAAAITQATAAGRPETFAGISPFLKPETQAYVPGVLGGGKGGAGQAAPLSPESLAHIQNITRETVEQTLADFGALQQQVQNLVASGANFNNVLGRDINREADRLVEKLTNISVFFARAPQAAEQLGEALQQQVLTATKEAVVWQAGLGLEAQRRDLLKQQTEQIEQATIRRQAELVTMRQGQQEAERFTRLETARLQQARLAETPKLAGMTPQEQTAFYANKLVELQNRFNEFGTQVERQRADLMRPHLEAELQRVETFMGRPGTSMAQQAQANVLQQAEGMRAQLETTIAELAKHPSLQDLREKFQHALQGLGEAAAAQSEIAFARVTNQAQQHVMTIQAQLDQVLAFSGRAGRSAPEQAQAQVLQQGITAEAQLRRAIEEVKQSLDMQQLAPNLRQQLETALEGLPEGVRKQGQLAFEQMDMQIRDRIAGMGDQLDQLRMKLSAAGLNPLEADLAKIRREFAAMLDTLDKLEAKLGEEYLRATPERQEEIKALVDQLRATRPQVQPGLDAALQERQLRPQIEYLEQLQRQLEQSQVAAMGPATLAGNPQLEVQLAELRRNRAGEERLQTPEGRQQAAELEAQIRAQERLNYEAGLFIEVGNSIGSAWTNALMSIANGTATVSDAFQAMAQSIMMSLAQIASQEAWKAFIGLGLRLVFGAAAGAATGGLGGGMGAEVGTGPDVGFGFAPGGALGDTSWIGGAMGGGFAEPATMAFQHGGVVRRPTMAMLGEGPHNPEYVLNKLQMEHLMTEAVSRGPSAGGQAVGAANVAVINVASEAQGEQERARRESMGYRVVVNHVLKELSSGEGSQINRALRTLQR
jgi:tape measure domain-containing protein